MIKPKMNPSNEQTKLPSGNYCIALTYDAYRTLHFSRVIGKAEQEFELYVSGPLTITPVHRGSGDGKSGREGSEG